MLKTIRTCALLLAACVTAAMVHAAPADITGPPVTGVQRADLKVTAAATAADAEDLERNRRHAAALAEKRQELDALRDEVHKLRAVAKMCIDGAPKPAVQAAMAAAPPRR